MDLKNLSERVTLDLCNVMTTPPSTAERAAFSRIIGQAILDASGQAHHTFTEAVVVCCGPEADLAHKIQSHMDKRRDMLVANLMAMR